MNLSTLKQLQKRIREATGPDRELDWAIANTFPHYDGQKCWLWPGDTCWQSVPPPWTRSIDACVALLLEALPGSRWAGSSGREFWVFAGERGSNENQAQPLANDCLTFIDAIIEAYAAKIAELEAEQKERVG